MSQVKENSNVTFPLIKTRCTAPGTLRKPNYITGLTATTLSLCCARHASTVFSILCLWFTISQDRIQTSFDYDFLDAERATRYEEAPHPSALCKSVSRAAICNGWVAWMTVLVRGVVILVGRKPFVRFAWLVTKLSFLFPSISFSLERDSISLSLLYCCSLSLTL